jgi:hypothetical protein
MWLFNCQFCAEISLGLQICYHISVCRNSILNVCLLRCGNKWFIIIIISPQLELLGLDRFFKNKSILVIRKDCCILLKKEKMTSQGPNWLLGDGCTSALLFSPSAFRLSDISTGVCILGNTPPLGEDISRWHSGEKYDKGKGGKGKEKVRKGK